jgi:hypothetical protein
MRLICPHCQQSVTLPDPPPVPSPAAGGGPGWGPTPCPLCNQSITPPALTGAAIDAAPVPPPAAPPTTNVGRQAPGFVNPAPAPTPSPVDQGSYSPRSAGHPWFHITLRREVAHWLTPGALVVAFVLTCFTWVAVAPNGNRIYTQNAWHASWGTFATDSAGENVMKVETELNTNIRVSLWILFYWLLLIPTAIVAIADRVLSRNPAAVPDAFRMVWPHRQMIVAASCAALLLFLLLPMTFRFGLESAAMAAAETAVPIIQAAPGQPEPTTTAKTERDLRRDMKVASFGLTRTIWFDLAVLTQIIALAGIGTSWWLDRHPNAPDPRLEIYC